MIKVYNKQSKYLRVSGKIIAPFKTEDFEERNQQIRILERNGIVVVTDVLSENTTPAQSNVIETHNGEEQQVVLDEQPEIIDEVSDDKEMQEDNLSDEKIEEPVEDSKETKIEETEEVQEKKAKRTKKSKKGGNK